MNQKNLERVEFAKKTLSERDIIFRELPNGQLQVDGVNFWATSEKWHDPKSGNRGQGLNSFIRFLKQMSLA